VLAVYHARRRPRGFGSEARREGLLVPLRGPGRP
jgi:hypothetical protein